MESDLACTVGITIVIISRFAAQSLADLLVFNQSTLTHYDQK